MGTVEIRIADAEQLVVKLASVIEQELNAAVALRGYANLAVSGGNTPRALLTALSTRDISWENVNLTLADERWVDALSAHSNEAMLRETLLRGDALKANFIPLKNAAATALNGQQACNDALAKIPGGFDLVMLGMGLDGHTASLFPGVSKPALDPGCRNLCIAIQPQNAPHERISLTANAILNSRKILLHIEGDAKWQVYQQAVAAGPIEAMPIRVVLHQDLVPVEVYWCP